VSALSSLNTARLGMAAQQRALDVTSQNIANVNTAGYSRQRVDLQSIGASTVPALFSVSTEVGGGVNADTVTRIRDSFAENRALGEHAGATRLTVQSAAYSQIEDAFREPGETGLQTALTDMWSSWEDLANASDMPAARQAVLENTAAVVGSLTTTRATLDAQWTQTRQDLGALVDDVNAAAAQIASLNQAIQRASQAGVNTNELADKRDGLVLSLAEKVGATASPGSDGMVDVLVGGSTLVSGPADGTPVTAANLALLITDPAGLAASAISGAASADGNHALAMGRLGETGGVDSDYRQLITGLGVQSSVSARNLTIQATIAGSVDATRESTSGVSLDEEMTQMLAFQHGYEAAARMITAMDEVLDTLINNTGRVGR
jgi:flagellar hook-associated protein 1